MLDIRRSAAHDFMELLANGFSIRHLYERDHSQATTGLLVNSRTSGVGVMVGATGIEPVTPTMSR